MKIFATIEARMNSSRLPGKVMMPVLNRPMIGYLIDRLKAVPSLDGIVLATTTNEVDNILVDFAKSEDIHVFRGSENDVMSRVIEAADSVDADTIVEITGDCPIIDPDLVEQTILLYKKNKADYAANSFFSSYPDGMDTQVISTASLKKSASMTSDPLDREHVSRHIVNNDQIFKHVYLIAPPSLHWPGLGLTLDEQADFDLIRTLIERLSPENPMFGCNAIIKYLQENPEILAINQNVARKDARPT
ncbi:cytidylyltransferase domain-containing protein [Thalassospira xiamenensis]|uniref:Spore coat polysaccharide biosynthesis protein SpsF n=1 Tax=Thalassospira xiamenensis TaxID=220697 RepID=A0A285T5T9_9PROT|nr:glycosyltransferase family protein [Thalassospira xiamenensis]SOC16699.1 spore coat polysaccharide biosynthesis protein SpsF [Thalassospira xiamenensis]